MGEDRGPVVAGFLHNFRHGAISLANNAYVQLVDLFGNSPGAGQEAIYVKQLVVPLGTTLDLNGINLYCNTAEIDGVVIGGTVMLVTLPDIIVSSAVVAVNEGSSNTFTVRLAFPPAANVTVNVARASGDTDLSVSGGSLMALLPPTGTRRR